MRHGMTNMFDTLTPNIDTTKICDHYECKFALSNVGDHSSCDISWSGAAAIGIPPLDILKSSVEAWIFPMDKFITGQPLTISLSCPSQ